MFYLMLLILTSRTLQLCVLFVAKSLVFGDKSVTLVTVQMHVKSSTFDFNVSEVAAHHKACDELNQGFPLCSFEPQHITRIACFKLVTCSYTPVLSHGI